jgi:hypothetical protein
MICEGTVAVPRRSGLLPHWISRFAQRSRTLLGVRGPVGGVLVLIRAGGDAVDVGSRNPLLEKQRFGDCNLPAMLSYLGE